MLPDSLRHLQQNAMNLRLLFLQQPHQLVVLLNSFQRLNKHRLPAGAGAVHHALHAPLLLNFYRNNEALAAYRNQFVLNRSALGQAAQIAAQGFLNRALLFFDFSANSRQFG